jgi:hypothetical protein
MRGGGQIGSPMGVKSETVSKIDVTSITERCNINGNLTVAPLPISINFGTDSYVGIEDAAAAKSWIMRHPEGG